MARSTQRTRFDRNRIDNQVNLVSARSRSTTEAQKLSRLNSAGGYAQLRKKRARKKRLVMGTCITLASLLIASLVAVAAYAVMINNKFGTDLQGNKANFDSGIYEGVFTAPTKPEDPFWILLVGTDDREGFEIPRTDTIILARVDPPNKKVAMISIPRDTYVNIPGYGYNKINSAWTFAEVDEPGSGPASTIKTVEAFSGVKIAYLAQVNFPGLERLVNDLGGVEVDVPVDIIGDSDAGGLDIYTGIQTLDGAHALTFCRSRQFEQGDYQRQANQRTFLQALAKQILAADPATIATTLTNMADMTFTNMELPKMISVAQSMRGLQEGDIHTYHVPSYTDDIYDPSEGIDISYVIADDYAWQELIGAINAGEYPPPQDDPYAGVMPDSYAPRADGEPDPGVGASTNINPADYKVDVLNGYGIEGMATSVSDMLVLSGYQKGSIGTANSFSYTTTFIIYQNLTDKPAADDIHKRLGYGKVLASEGRYDFTGNVLVVVGGDFKSS